MYDNDIFIQVLLLMQTLYNIYIKRGTGLQMHSILKSLSNNMLKMATLRTITIIIFSFVPVLLDTPVKKVFGPFDLISDPRKIVQFEGRPILPYQVHEDRKSVV